MMKKRLLFLTLVAAVNNDAFCVHSQQQGQIYTQYLKACREISDIYEHVPVLKSLASECSSVVEIGVRHMVSTWGILQGLSESRAEKPSYLGIDLEYPPAPIYRAAVQGCHESGITFNFLALNDMTIDIEPCDMLFIDSLHTYCHLTYELEKFSSKVRTYIAMHDTSAPWGNADDAVYTGNYAEYPSEYDRTKRGLWPAVEDFLKRHPEWQLHERRFNNHGFTILKRVSL